MTAEIDKLLDFFVTEDGTPYYQVKWKTTWERADTLAQFSELIDQFWKSISNANRSNILNNLSRIKKPDPVIIRRPAPVQQKIPPSPKTPQHPSQRRRSSSTITQPTRSPATTPQRRANSSSSPQVGLFQNQQQQLQPNNTSIATPQKNNTSTVVIDSDDEDVTSNRPSQDLAINQHLLKQPKIEPGTQTWNSIENIKLENNPPDQKPYIDNNMQLTPQSHHPQQPQQMFQGLSPKTMKQPSNNSPRIINPTRSGGRSGSRGGRGGGSSPVKRKLGMPNMNIQSPPKRQQFGIKNEQMGFEGSDSANSGVKTEDANMEGALGSNGKAPSGDWKDNFEKLENFVDGKLVSCSYKCCVCGTTIAQQGNCQRHFNKHREGEHECPICGKRFTRIDYIERHLKQHGTGTSDELQRMIKLIAAGMKKKK